MPIDPVTQDFAAVATTSAFGLGAAGVVALSKQMTRREVTFHLAGGALLSATIPQVAAYYFGLPSIVNWLMGVMCGFSVPLLVGRIQAYTARKMDEISPEAKP